MKIHRYILAAAALLAAAACGGPGGGGGTEAAAGDNAAQEDNAVVEEVSEGGVPVDNALMRRFADLARRGEIEVLTHSYEPEDSLKVWSAVRELGRYAEGKLKDFPATEVRSAMGEAAFQLGYEWSHCDNIDDTPLDMFLLELMDEAAKYTPQIDHLSDFHSEDGNVGIINYHEWSPAPLYSFMIYRSGNGFRKLQVGNKGEVRIDKIFQPGEVDGDSYYLLSNNTTSLSFCQYLYRLHNGEAELVSSINGFPTMDEGWKYDIIYNPRTYTWCYCTRRGEYYHKVDGSPVVRLDFNGPRSRFILERP